MIRRVPKYCDLAAAALLLLTATPAAAECVIGSAPMTDPFAAYKGGDSIVHKDSGFVFPASVAGFQRKCEMTRDFSGDHFEIGYSKMIDGEPVDVRIVVVHLEELTAAQHYQIVKPDAISHYSSSAVRYEGDYLVSGRPDLSAYQGIFDGELAGIPWHFSITAIDYGYWDARLSASYPEEIDEGAQSALMELITAFQWQTPVAGEAGEDDEE